MYSCGKVSPMTHDTIVVLAALAVAGEVGDVREGQLAGDVPATAFSSHCPGARMQRAADRHRLDVADR